MNPNRPSARDRILAKLRQGTPSHTTPTLPDVAGWYAAHRPLEPLATKTKRFCEAIELAQAQVHSVHADNWVAMLAQVLRACGSEPVLLAKGTAHGDKALAELPEHGIKCRTYDENIETWKPVLFNDIPASLTMARAAIAETGSLILWPDEKEPRLMSLVPPVHIVLLDAKNIYGTFHEALCEQGWHRGLPTNALLISGPSKTADIQQTLAYGAHGPKALVVLMLNADEETP
jgi:L-lactate dehydrogenase complex protein LldG